MNKTTIGIVALAIFITGSVFILVSKENSVKNDSNNGVYENTVDSTASKVNTNVVVPASKTSTNTPAVKTTPAVVPASKVNSAPTGFTLSDVENHNSSSNCWTAVYGNVYDVTSFISQHPGGSREIISLCGRDGTNTFDNQHGGERRANAELGNYKIGTLLK
ncbi:MAG: hypothetical protein RL687_167 [Candidatus Parcubacteria bacterium]|jgi:cytochrome b involved in lipid metabolism